MAAIDSATVNAFLDEIIATVNTTWDYFALFGIFCSSAGLLYAVRRCFSAFYTYIVSRVWCFGDLWSTRYGGRWAVVTGASDGIGRSYALQLAERGMNIVLISRNITKLTLVAEQIKLKYNVETRCIPMDLCELSKCEKYNELKLQLDELDIAILVNNVGVMYERLQYFLTVPKETLIKIIELNISATVLLTYMLLPQMCQRKKGAIINVGSIASVCPTPLMTAYAASKAFVDSFTDALQYEYKSYGIFMQAVRPAYVSTNMTFKGSPNLLLANPDAYVRSALSTVGYSHGTYGYWSHGVFGVVGEFMPQWLYRWSAVHVNPLLWSWLTGVKLDCSKKTN